MMESPGSNTTENIEVSGQNGKDKPTKGPTFFTFDDIGSYKPLVSNSSPRTPSVFDSNSEVSAEVTLRPHREEVEKRRILSATLVPSGNRFVPRKTQSSTDLSSSKNVTKKKNDNMVLELIVPGNNSTSNYENIISPRLNSLNTLSENVNMNDTTYSIYSQNVYGSSNNAGNINHSSTGGSEEYLVRTPGGQMVPSTPASSNIVDDPTPHEEKRRAFLNILMKTLSLFYGLLIVTIGLAMYMADLVDRTFYTAEIFSLILVSMAGIYILFLTVDIAIFTSKKTKYEKLITEGLTEVEMTTTTDGHFQFNIVLPEIKKLGKSIKHDYCFNEDRHSTNFFLKVGATAFCFVHLIHSGLQLVYRILFIKTDKENCGLAPLLILDIAYPVYSSMLLFFIFKYSNVIINRHVILARFGIMHCFSSSICFWMWTIIREISEAISIKTKKSDDSEEEENMETYSLNKTTLKRFTKVCDYQDTSTETLYTDISPYLFPFSVEFSILLVGVLYLVWQNIGICKLEDESEATTSQCKSPPAYYDDKDSNIVLHVDCKSSSKGLFGGFVFMVVVIVSSIFFLLAVYLDDGTRSELGATVNIVTSLVVLSTMVVVCILGYRQITRLDLNSAHHNLLDDVLLLICIPAFFFNGIFSIIPAIVKNDVLRSITIVVEIIQVLIQTVFILDGLRRSSNTKKLRKLKPGRELVTFLIIANISLWLMQTLAVKSSDLKDFRYDFYGKVLWTVLGHLCLPFMMFYRFHSSVCFGDIWKYGYMPSGHRHDS